MTIPKMPSAPFQLISIDNLQVVQAALAQTGLWEEGESICDVQSAGDGNMNAVLRVVTSHRRVILKQSRPWVEKYPQIEAPAERIFAEIDFYQRIAPHAELAGSMPLLLGSNVPLHLMAMEDLGVTSDYSGLYMSRDLKSMPLDCATRWLAALHRVPVSLSDGKRIGNRALRELNHAHLFQIPLQTPSAIPLDDICSGLEHLAAELRKSQRIQDSVRELGEAYLATGSCLLHGDFYPGSWLKTKDGFRVIDPEFCFAGPAEFDLGVFAGHRILIGGSVDSVDVILRQYCKLSGNQVDPRLARGYAAVEVIRRLIGVAQLPLHVSLAQRAEMARIARSLLELP